MAVEHGRLAVDLTLERMRLPRVLRVRGSPGRRLSARVQVVAIA